MQSVDTGSTEVSNNLSANVLPAEVEVAEDVMDNEVPEKTCSDANLSTFKAPLIIAERSNCSFGVGNNLTASDGRFRAIEKTSLPLKVPNVQEICTFSVSSPQGAVLHYDDYLFMTLNDRVLMSSEDKWTKLLEDDGRFKKFDFLKLRDQPHSFVEQDPTYGTPYCYLDQTCVVPGHDQVGEFMLNINKAETLTDMLSKDGDFTFTVWASGDNDSLDCGHSKIELDLQVSYISK